MKAFGYIRVSTAMQVEEGYGLPVQERAIFDYAARQGIEIVKIYRDEGVSGASGEAVRPGLASALSALEGGEANALVVARLDRLARDLVLQETICDRLAKKGVALVSATEPDISGDPTRILIRQVLGALAEYQRQVLKANLLNGKLEKSSRGGYIGGRPPFGWKVVDRELVQDPDEQRVVVRLRALSASGESMNGIARTLNAEGYGSKMGTPWTATTVRRVLQRIKREEAAGRG